MKSSNKNPEKSTSFGSSFLMSAFGIFTASSRLKTAQNNLRNLEKNGQELIARTDALIASQTQLNEEAQRCLAETDKILDKHNRPQ
jgi:hypothetical protein